MWSVALVAVAAGLSNFAASIGIGLSGVDGRVRTRVAVVFGFFEAVMPVVGLLVGQRVAGSIGAAASDVGGGLLVLAGVSGIAAARRGAPKAAGSPTRTSTLLITGFALSIDNLVIGFALGASNVPVALAAVIIAAVSVGMSMVGLELGRRLGPSVERWSAEIGGCVLVLVGVAIAAGVL